MPSPPYSPEIDPDVLRAALQAFEFLAGPADDPQDGADLPGYWDPWLGQMFPGYVAYGYADYHREFWEWVWGITLESSPDPFVGIWSRGAGKSTSTELAAAALGLRGRRRYAIYVRGSQRQADKSVQNIASLLESSAVERHYPRHARRAVSKYGSPKGWRRERLWTSGGFVVDALGLDTAIRGIKVDEQRPDLIIFDDIDGKLDTERTTQKKLDTITTGVLPAGAPNACVLAVQNLIIPNGVFARLADGRADFLVDRHVSGPHPLIEGFEFERYETDTGRMRYRITAGEPTWPGMPLTRCTRLLNRIGPKAFLEECQHAVDEREGALWRKADLEATRVMVAPERFKKIAVGVDPSGGGDAIGIIVVGLCYDDHLWVLADFTAPGNRGPLFWGQRACQAFAEHEADRVVGERNFGGDLVRANIKTAAEGAHVAVKLVSVSRGKDIRAEPYASEWSLGTAHIVGRLPALEAELTGWRKGDSWSPNRLDALVIACGYLKPMKARTMRVIIPGETDEDEGEEAA